MSILVNKQSRIIVQGMTGNQGSFHTKLMLNYGTNIVAGVTPGKGGQSIHNVPVYNSVQEALNDHQPDWSVIFVPAKFCKAAALEALENNLNIVIITENLPVHDVIEIMQKAKGKDLTVIGPNCPGLLTTNEAKLGIIPGHIFKKGNIGLVSRSGTLTYEIVNEIVKGGHGISTAIGIGGDAIIGTDFIQALKLFEQDQETEKIVLVGEIGGNLEEKAAEYIKTNIKKEVVAYITGVTAPKGKRMGHAGAIISGKTGTAKSKIQALEQANVKVAKLPSEIAKLLN
ncbi:MAG: succinate--CoA ligase subunit alpha [archaeon]